MRYWLGGAFVVFLALVQSSSVQQFNVLGVVPNLMLVLLVCWLVVRGLEDVLPMVGVAGVTLGFIGLQTPGLVLLALLSIPAFGIVRELRIVHSDFLLALAIVAASSLTYECVMLAGVMLGGGQRDVIAAVADDLLPAMLVNLAITPPVYFLMRLARPADRGRRLSY